MDIDNARKGHVVVITGGPYGGTRGTICDVSRQQGRHRIQVAYTDDEGDAKVWSAPQWVELDGEQPPHLRTISGPPPRAERKVACGHCGSGDALVLLDTVVGQVVIGAREDGSFIPDGGPEHYEVDHGQGQVIWCYDCQLVVFPEPKEDEDDA